MSLGQRSIALTGQLFHISAHPMQVCANICPVNQVPHSTHPSVFQRLGEWTGERPETHLGPMIRSSFSSNKDCTQLCANSTPGTYYCRRALQSDLLNTALFHSLGCDYSKVFQRLHPNVRTAMNLPPREKPLLLIPILHHVPLEKQATHTQWPPEIEAVSVFSWSSSQVGYTSTQPFWQTRSGVSADQQTDSKVFKPPWISYLQPRSRWKKEWILCRRWTLSRHLSPMENIGANCYCMSQVSPSSFSAS